MAFNSSFMMQEYSALRESLVKSGLFETQEHTFQVTGQQEDVFVNPMVKNLYAQTDVRGASIEAEEVAIQKLDQIKVYKEQMQRVETSSKLMRGSRLKKLRAMGNDFGEEVQKNAQAEFIREKILTHIELLEKNDGLPEVDGFEAEEALFALMSERANKFNPLNPDDKIEWQDMLSENRESLDLEINIAKRRRYVDTMLQPMLDEISGGQFTANQALMGNLMRSIMSLPAQLKLTQLMEERIERKHTHDELAQERVEVRRTADQAYSEYQRLYPKYKLAKRNVPRLEERYERLMEKARKELRTAYATNYYVPYYQAVENVDQAYSELTKAKLEFEKLSDAYYENKYSWRDHEKIEHHIKGALEETKESEFWKNDYQERGNRYVAELERMVRVPVSTSRNYDILARDLHLTAVQDPGDIFLYQTMREWDKKTDDFNEWVLNPVNERAYKEYQVRLAHWRENDDNQEYPTLDMPPLLQLNIEQQKKLINNLFECYEKRILIPRGYGLEIGNDVEFMYDLLIVNKKQLLPAYGRYNPKRYNEFFSNPYAGLGTLDMKLFHDERIKYMQKMEQDGKSESARTNFEVYMNAYERQMLLRKRDYVRDGWIQALSPAEQELLNTD